MANNYLQFSEVIPNLIPEEEAWLKQQLGLIAVRDGEKREIPDWNDEATAGADWIGPRFLQDYEDYEPMGSGPDFEYQFDDDGPSNWGRHLWVYGAEYGDPGQVAHLVQKLLKRFRRDQCWSLTYAQTCSKLRVSEFSGGAVFVTAYADHLDHDGLAGSSPVQVPADTGNAELAHRIPPFFPATKPKRRFLLKPIVEDIADQIINRREDCRLTWESHYRVIVNSGKIIPKRSARRRIRKGRQERFRAALRDRLKREGWVYKGNGVYVCVK